MGQSAGGAHVAAYVAQQRFHAAAGEGPGIAGAVMISGIYDAVTNARNQFSDAYYGEGPELRNEARCIDGLLASALPLLFTVSEIDPADFQDQAAQLAAAWHAKKGSYPPLEYLAGHNHLTPAQTLGSGEAQFASRLQDFMAVVSER
jgi:triacylglycerol lipase